MSITCSKPKEESVSRFSRSNEELGVGCYFLKENNFWLCNEYNSMKPWYNKIFFEYISPLSKRKNNFITQNLSDLTFYSYHITFFLQSKIIFGLWGNTAWNYDTTKKSFEYISPLSININHKFSWRGRRRHKAEKRHSSLEIRLKSKDCSNNLCGP